MLHWIFTAIMSPLRGEETLFKVFWVYAVLVSILSLLAQIMLAFYPLPLPAMLDAASGSISTVVGYAYTLWLNAALWQCAFNTRSKLTAYLTRFGVVVSVIFVIISALFQQYGMDIIPTDASTQAQTEQLTRILELLKH
jgi:hypothetical protein